MSQRANYFKVGLFVLTGVFLGIAGLLGLGAREVFRKKIAMETYVDESVQGLEVGSPVKFRGVQLGNVRALSFVHTEYADEIPAKEAPPRYVLVHIDLFPEAFYHATGDNGVEVLGKEIERGLRTRLASQGLTGMLYLELDYFPPKQNPPLPISWTPRSVYIPSAPSLIFQVTTNLQNISNSVAQTDFKELSDNSKKLLSTLNSTVEQARVGDVSQRVLDMLEEVRSTNRRVLELLGRKELDNVPPDIAAITASARRTTEESERSVRELLAEFARTSDNVTSMTQELDSILRSKPVRESIDNAATTSRNVAEASAEFPEAMARVNRTLTRVEGLLQQQQEDLSVTLENLRQITENLKDLSRDAREYPAGVLFGEAPSERTPAKK